MPRLSKVTKFARTVSVIDGLTKRMKPSEPYVLSGKRFTQAQLLAVFRAHRDALSGVDHARARFRAAVAKERKAAAEAAATTARLKAWVANEFGLDLAVWADFGWVLPKKPGPKTVGGKARGVAKRAAAREARKKRTSGD